MVDLQHWDHRWHYGHVEEINLGGLDEDEDSEVVDDFDIRTMAKLIWRPLADECCRYGRTEQHSIQATMALAANAKAIVCIV